MKIAGRLWLLRIRFGFNEWFLILLSNDPVTYWHKSTHKYLFDVVYCNTSLRAWFSFDPGFQLVTGDKNVLKKFRPFPVNT